MSRIVTADAWTAATSRKVDKAEQGSFWRYLARALDAHFARRTGRSVSATVLRRSRHDVARCRRLAHAHATTPTRHAFEGLRAEKARP